MKGAARGWRMSPPAPILRSMSFLRSVSPSAAWADVRQIFTTRRRHQLGIMGVSLALTYVVVAGMVIESKIPPKPYHRDIIYVEQYRADRTDAEIIAQQKIDGAKKIADKKELERLEAERRAQFKKVNDQLKALGI